MRKIIFIVIIFVFAFMFKNLNAQDGNTIYFMNNIPQSNYSNPATLPNCKFYLGIPAMSSISFNLENGSFSYNDMFSRRADDSLIIDKDKLLGALSDNNKLSYDFSEQIFAMGFRVKRNYFTLSAATKISTNFNYTKDFMTFLLKGNEAFLGTTASLSDSKLGLNAYTEIALGFSREINKKLTLGIRFKYLIGIVNVYTERSNLQLATDANTYALTASSDFLIYSSSPFDSIQSIDKQMKDLKPSNINDNTGFAFDFGGEYRLNKKWTFGMSVVDLGSINWKSNVKEYRSKSPNKQFVFSGFDLNEIFKGDTLNNTVFDNLVDSLKETIGIKEMDGTSYRAPLKTKLFTSVAFSLTPNDRFGLLMRNDFANQSVNTLVSISYNRNIGRWFAITLSNTMVAGKLFNPGGGFNINLGPFQFYFIGDHFSSLYAADMKNLGLHFGMNLLFGKTKQGYRYEKEKIAIIEEEKSSRYKKLQPIIVDSTLKKDSSLLKSVDTIVMIDSSRLIPIETIIQLPSIDTVVQIPVDTVKTILIPLEIIPTIVDKAKVKPKAVKAAKAKPTTVKKPIATKPKAATTTPKKTLVKPKTTAKPLAKPKPKK